MSGGRIVFRPQGNQGPDPGVQGVHGKVLTGLPGGTFSGETNCVMRYWVAECYAPAMGSGTRYFFDGPNGEKAGSGLCDSRTDSAGGVNHPNHAPRPRYGDASEGGCRERFCVNDARH